MTNDIDSIATILRAMVDHETEQVDRRLQWLCQLQGFLFAALGFAWDKGKQLTNVLAGIGISVAVLILMSLITSTFAIERLRMTWLATKPGNYTGPEIWGFYPDKVPFTVYTSPENLLPLVLMVGWFCVMWCKRHDKSESAARLYTPRDERKSQR